MVHLDARAREELKPGEALVFDWHRVAICCAAAGEVSLRRTKIGEIRRSKSFQALTADDSEPVFAHRRIHPHLVDRDIEVRCRRLLGMRHFTSTLPTDFGLRVCLGRVPAGPDPGGSQ